MRYLKSLRLLVSLSVIVLLTSTRAFANNECDTPPGAPPSNAGTQFLLCFEQNDVPEPDPSKIEYLEIDIAALDDPTTVTITCNRYPSMNKVFTIGAHGAVTYRITDDSILHTGGASEITSDLWINSSEQPDERVVQITSTNPVVVYGFNHKWETSDAFLALPYKANATDYRIMSFYNSNANAPPMPSEFAVAAFNDSTFVTITPSAPTLGGHPAGVPFTIRLNKGEAVQVQTDPQITDLDLTGSVVQSTQPIAVYGGHARTEVEHNFFHPNQQGTSRDMLAEQLPPTSTWGKTFVLSPFILDNAGTKNPSGDLMRILALNDNTTINLNGKSWRTIGKNAHADTLIRDPVVVEASGAILVGEYAHTSMCGNCNGDPFLAIVPPIDQMYNSYTFYASRDTASWPIENVMIATDSVAQSSIVLDGTLTLPKTIFKAVPAHVNGRAFSVAQVGLGPGIHTLETTAPPTQGFTILSYGLGAYDSYGYTAGQLLKPLRALVIDQLPTASMHGRHANEVMIRSTANEAAYVDTATFTPDTREDAFFGVRIKENVCYDIDRLGWGESAAMHFTSSVALSSPVQGTLRVYSHTPSFKGLEAAEAHVTVYPESSASVGDENSYSTSISTYPNPFTNFTTVTFTLPEPGDVTLTLYNEIGEEMRHITASSFGVGEHSIRIDRLGLAHGFYTLEVTSEKLHWKMRKGLVVSE